MEFGLVGRRCLVTGAGSGIGRAVARMMAAEGVRLAIVARHRDALAALADEIAADEIAARGVRPLVLTADLATADGCAAVAAAVRDAFGGLDILVNNAGGSRPLSADAGDAVWQEGMALNFDAARRLTEAFATGMKTAGWGRVVNVTGAVAAKALNAAIPAKAALESWSRGMAAELAPHGVTVNCVAPGRINTVQILTRLHPTEASRQAFIARNIPMGRFGEPEELAYVVVFLASAGASYVTGVTIPVDGGALRPGL